MASTTAGARLTDAHRVAQGRLSAETVARLVQVWPLLDPTNLDGTADRWITAASAIVEAQRTRSAALADAYQTQFRAMELGASVAPVPSPPVPPLVAEALRTSLLTQGPVKVKALVAGGQTTDIAAEAARLGSALAGTRHASDGGRAAILAATDADPLAHGVRRVTSPGCCAFCAMLAARSADGLSSNATRSGMESFKVHDNCHCFPETAYATGFQDATRQAKEFHALYHEATAGVGGSKAQLNAFRRALAAQRA